MLVNKRLGKSKMNTICILKHGCSKHPPHKVWSDMINRCGNSKCKDYRSYGGRGIVVCSKWRNDPIAFTEWALANGWEKGLTLERINNDGNYEPENCCFVTRLQQQNNTRKLRLFVAYGPCGQMKVSKNQRAFARKWNLNNSHISRCLLNKRKSYKGWTFERIDKPYTQRA